MDHNIYIYIYIYTLETVVEGNPKASFSIVNTIYMIKISEKVDKSKTYNRFSGNISFFLNRRTSSDEG